ncbi:MAG: DUF484 family protein [Paracoccaceae bacterium]
MSEVQPMETLQLSAEDRDLVRSLIVAEPNIVLDDDDVMQRLVGETRGTRKVVDLRDRLVERLETRLEKLATTHRSVIAAAYENVAGTNQLHRAVLYLIEPPDLSSFLVRLTHEVPSLMGLEEARLCLEADVKEPCPAPGFDPELAGRVMAMPAGAISEYFSIDGLPDRQIALRAAGEEAELIFGEANPVQSEALLRLDLGGAQGLLALASSDPRKFDPAHGTDLLQFFAGVVERLLLQQLAGDAG